MWIERIEENRISELEGMDQLSLLERASFPGYYVLAAYDDESKEAGDEAVGCILFSLGKKGIVIQWIYVEPSYRGRGVSDELILAARDAGYENAVTELNAYIPSLYGRKIVCVGEESYIDYAFGDETDSSLGEWSTSFEALLKHPLFRVKEQEEGYDLFSFSDLKMREIGKAIENIREKAGVLSLYDVSGHEDLIEPEISIFSFEKGTQRERPNGCILFQKAGNTLYPVYVYAGDTDVLKAMIRKCIKATKDLYGNRQKIRMILREEPDFETADILDDIFQIKRPGYGRYYQADTVTQDYEDNDSPGFGSLNEEV